MSNILTWYDQLQRVYDRHQEEFVESFPDGVNEAMYAQRGARAKVQLKWKAQADKEKEEAEKKKKWGHDPTTKIP